jgi:hypothetical protein
VGYDLFNLFLHCHLVGGFILLGVGLAVGSIAVAKEVGARSAPAALGPFVLGVRLVGRAVSPKGARVA